MNGEVLLKKKANLVLLDKNPLENIANMKTVNTVILNGQVLKPEALLKN